MEKYEIDKSISVYMLQYMNHDVYKNIVKLFNIINDINNIPDLDVTIELSELESSIVSIITTEDELSSNMNLNIKNIIIKYVSTCLQDLGITIIKDDVTYTTLLDILEGIYTLYTLDNDNMQYILTMYDVSEDVLEQDTILLFSNLLSNYTTMSTLSIYELIDNVSTDIISNLVNYCILKIEENTKELNKEIDVKVNKLIKVEPYVTETFYYKDMMANGYTEQTLQESLDTLFNSINKHGDNVAGIIPEILITIYMSTDNSGDIMLEFNNKIDLTLADNLNASRINTIKELLSEVATKLKSGV